MSAQKPGKEEPGCELKAIPKKQVKSILTEKAGDSGMNRRLTRSVEPHTTTHLSRCNMHQVLPNTSSQLEKLNFTVSIHSTCDPPNQSCQFHHLASGKILVTALIQIFFFLNIDFIRSMKTFCKLI